MKNSSPCSYGEDTVRIRTLNPLVPLAAEEVGDLYSKLKDDVSFRQEWGERVGLGFQLGRGRDAS